MSFSDFPFVGTPGAPELPKLPVQYEVKIDFTPDYRVGSIQAYGATKDDADEIAEFVRRVSKAVYVSEDISEGDGE